MGRGATLRPLLGGPEKRRRGPEDGQRRSRGAVGAAAERAWEPALAPARALTAQQATRRASEPRQQRGQQHRPAAPLPAAWPGSGAPSDPGALRRRWSGRTGSGALRNANGGRLQHLPNTDGPGTRRTARRAEEPACRPSAPGDVTAGRAAPPAARPRSLLQRARRQTPGPPHSELPRDILRLPGAQSRGKSRSGFSEIQ